MATRKQAVGSRFEADEKSGEKTPLKTAVEIAAIEKAVAAEKFPTDLKKAFELLHQVNSEQVSTAEEWEAKQPRLTALKLHIHKLQQGLPLVEPKSGDINHAHMAVVMGQMKLERMMKSIPEVATVVKERDALKKANSELVKERDALKKANSELVKERDALKKANSELVKERDALVVRVTELAPKTV